MRTTAAVLGIVIAVVGGCAEPRVEPATTAARSDSSRPVGPRPAPPTPSLDDPGVFVVPASINDEGMGNVARELQAWLDSLPDGSTAVIGRSLGSGEWTAGIDDARSTYRLTSALRLNQPLTLWGYGSRLLFAGKGTDVWSGGILVSAAASGSTVRGFEIAGNASHGGTRSAWSGEEGEAPHGIALLGPVKDVEIADNYIHDTKGDGIYKDAWPEFRPNTNSGGFWIHHNRIARTGRQGIVANLGGPTKLRDYGWRIERNQLHDIALYPIDAEDARSTQEFLLGIYVEDNDFQRWNWEAEASFNNRCHAISFTLKAGPDGDVHVIGSISDVYIRRNRFGSGDGCMGFGGDEHAAVGDPDGGTIILRMHDRSVISAPKSNVVIADNVWDVSAAQGTGPFASIADCEGLEVIGNDIEGSMELTTYRCLDVVDRDNH